MAEHLQNDLETPTCAAYPELAILADELRRACGSPVRMTGSGSAFFAPSATQAAALTLAGRVRTVRPKLRIECVPFET
jgi:4-diphosphocytidyl-2C-methyl-D-erythritol kinase